GVGCLNIYINCTLISIWESMFYRISNKLTNKKTQCNSSFYIKFYTFNIDVTLYFFVCSYKGVYKKIAKLLDIILVVNLGEIHMRIQHFMDHCHGKNTILIAVQNGFYLLIIMRSCLHI